MRGMFQSCESLKKINLSTFNTQNVIDMSFLFYKCKSLTSIDLSNFTIQNFTNIEKIFFGCKSLKKNKVITNNNKFINIIEDDCLIY